MKTVVAIVLLIDILSVVYCFRTDSLKYALAVVESIRLLGLRGYKILVGFSLVVWPPIWIMALVLGFQYGWYLFCVINLSSIITFWLLPKTRRMFFHTVRPLFQSEWKP